MNLNVVSDCKDFRRFSGFQITGETMFDRLFARPRPPARNPRYAYGLMAQIRDTLPATGQTARDRQRDFRAVFRSTPAGQRVLAQILDRCRVCGRSYVPGDSHETARREGARDTGLWLLDILADDDTERPRAAEADAPDTDAPDTDAPWPARASRGRS
jgi:hypothetical protein